MRLGCALNVHRHQPFGGYNPGVMAIAIPATPPSKDVIQELDSLGRRMAELRALLRFAKARERSAAKPKRLDLAERTKTATPTN